MRGTGIESSSPAPKSSPTLAPRGTRRCRRRSMPAQSSRTRVSPSTRSTSTASRTARERRREHVRAVDELRCPRLPSEGRRSPGISCGRARVRPDLDHGVDPFAGPPGDAARGCGADRGGVPVRPGRRGPAAPAVCDRRGGPDDVLGCVDEFEPAALRDRGADRRWQGVRDPHGADRGGAPWHPVRRCRSEDDRTRRHSRVTPVVARWCRTRSARQCSCVRCTPR